MKNLANGSAKIIATTTGWDINPRVLGTVPKEAEVGTLEGFHWVTDAHYAVVPKGVSADKQAAVLQLLNWMLTPQQQAKAYDKGYFYPGPAIKDVPLQMAPQDSQEAIGEFGRPEYERLIADNPHRGAAGRQGTGRGVRAGGTARSAAAKVAKPQVTLHPAATGRRDPRVRAATTRWPDLDLTIARGEFIALLGPSGCGKSTALNCLAGLLPLTRGSIWRTSTRLDTLPPERRGFGMVFQNYALFPHMSVRRNVAFGLQMRRLPRAEVRRRTDEAIRLVHLEEHAGKLPGQLSGGQQQRVAIARAVVLEPSLVLMDEPLSNLDAKLRLEMRTEIRRLHQSLGLTTVYVTHDQEEALSLADRLVVLREGRVQQIGTPERAAHPAGQLARRRLHGLPQPAADAGRPRPSATARSRSTARACGCSAPRSATVRRATAVMVGVRPEDLRIGPGHAGGGIAGHRRGGRVPGPRGRRRGPHRAAAYGCTCAATTRPGARRPDRVRQRRPGAGVLVFPPGRR